MKPLAFLPPAAKARGAPRLVPAHDRGSRIAAALAVLLAVEGCLTVIFPPWLTGRVEVAVSATSPLAVFDWIAAARFPDLLVAPAPLPVGHGTARLFGLAEIGLAWALAVSWPRLGTISGARPVLAALAGAALALQLARLAANMI